MILIGSIILVLLVMKCILSKCATCDILNDIAMKEPAFLLMREIMLVLCAVFIIEIVQYNNLMDYLEIDLSKAGYCLLVAISLWTLLGLIFISIAMRQVAKWNSLERMADSKRELEELKTQFE